MDSDSTPELAETAPLRRFRFGDVIADERYLTVTVDGETRQLTDLSWRFLLTLIDHAPNVASYEDLIHSVWNKQHVSDESVAQRLRQLRQALNDDPKEPKYIRNVRGAGYQLIPPVEQIFEDTGPARDEPKARSRTVIWGLVIGIGIAILAGIWWTSTNVADPNRLMATAQPQIDEMVSRADEYRNRGNAEANETAIDLYQQALAQDSEYLSALVGISLAYSHKTSKYELSADWAAKAADAADKALLIDPDHSGALAARGLADDARGRVSSAIRYYRESLKRNPEDQSIKASLAYLLQVQGHLYEALKLEAEALSEAPPTFFADYQIAIALDLAGLSAPSDRWLDRASTLHPDNIFLVEYRARQLVKSGRYLEAHNLLQDAGSDRFNYKVIDGIALLASNQQEVAFLLFSDANRVAETKGRICYECEAAAFLGSEDADNSKIETLLGSGREAVESGDEWPEFRLELAYLHLAIGDDKAAINSINEAFLLGYRDWKWIEATPLLRPLRGEARFRELVERMRADVAAQRSQIEADATLRPILMSN